MEAASEEFSKFLAISGKQSVSEWEKPELLNGSNRFNVRPREQPVEEETLRNFKADKSEVVRGDSKHFQSETPPYEALDALDNSAHYEGLRGKSHCAGPRCSEGFENQIGKKSHFGGRPSDAMASDVLVEGDDVHPRTPRSPPEVLPRRVLDALDNPVDVAFLCLTDDQKASSALGTDLYEEVICQLNFVACLRFKAWFEKSMICFVGTFGCSQWQHCVPPSIQK